MISRHRLVHFGAQEHDGAYTCSGVLADRGRQGCSSKWTTGSRCKPHGVRIVSTVEHEGTHGFFTAHIVYPTGTDVLSRGQLG